MNITVIGMGYVGLVTGACFSIMGNKVYCMDIDEAKIEMLKANIMPIYEPRLEDIVRTSHDRGDLIFTTNIKEALDNTNIIFIAVGTPMNEEGSVNLDYVFSTVQSIVDNITHESLVVVKSTVPVGTTTKIKEQIVKNCEVQVDIASNPEFLKEGAAVDDFLKPDRIVIGAESDKAFETLKDLYSAYVSNHDRFILMDIKSAEMTKYVANAMLATKISFMNEIANICEVTGANVKDVRLGIGSDRRIGYDFIYAGCGYGGSCFPKDIHELINTAQVNGYEPLILSDVEKVNNNQKKVLVNKVVERFGEDLSSLAFGIWGLSFKPNTDDVREAISLSVIPALIDKGAKIIAYDSHANDEFKKAVDDEYLECIKFADNRYDALDNCDALILITEWKEFRNPDFDLMASRLNKKIIFDGRNIYNKKIEEIGFELHQIGC